jgi:hypothetical protein
VRLKGEAQGQMIFAGQLAKVAHSFCEPTMKMDLHANNFSIWKRQMSYALQGLVFCFKKNMDYGAKLVADLSEAQMVSQPSGTLTAPANHPAWVLSHLNVYLPIMECLVRGESFPDPKTHRFGMTSKPEGDASIYASKAELMAEFIQGHQRVIDLLDNSDDSILSLPNSLERWKTTMPVVGLVLPYLMLNHENCHLGQVSAWRRLSGLPSV